jgi:multidrug efflux pump subunit AcrA (membrane-fusion protein)
VVDVTEMLGMGEVDETESAPVMVGQPVSFRLEALPELEWKATVQSLRPSVYRQNPKTPQKVIGLDLKFAETDAKRMRPGMLFRGRIETERASKVLLIPLEAVFIRPDGPIAFKRTRTGFERVKLTLGRRSTRYAEILGGLSEGDFFARRDLEREGKDQP